MGLQGQFRVAHHLRRQPIGGGGVDPARPVDVSQLPLLVVGPVVDLPALDLQLAQEQLALGRHRVVLPDRHGDGAADQ